MFSAINREAARLWNLDILPPLETETLTRAMEISMWLVHDIYHYQSQGFRISAEAHSELRAALRRVEAERTAFHVAREWIHLRHTLERDHFAEVVPFPPPSP